MNKYKKTNKTILLTILAFCLVSISIGFALLSTNLTINGVGSVTGTTWDIHFKSITLLDKSTEAQELSTPTITANGTKLSNINVRLPKRGNYIEYKAIIKNGGDYDAYLISYNLPSHLVCAGGTTEENYKACKYLKITITDINGAEYPKVEGDKYNETLQKNDEKELKIRIDYDKDNNMVPSDLINKNITIESVDITIIYGQKKGNTGINIPSQEIPNIKEDNLPSIYERMEYLESSGTQYIDTGYVQTSQFMKTDIKFQRTGTAQGQSVYGSQKNVGEDTSRVRYINAIPNINDNTLHFYIGQGVAFSSSSNINTISDFKADLSNGNYVAEFNGNITSGTYTGSLNTQYSMYLFADNFDGRAFEYFTGKIYYFKLYDDGNLVRDMVPVKVIKTGELGMYDKVNNIFYRNNGTGNFTYGDILPNTYQRLEYIKSTGTQLINTLITDDFILDMKAKFTPISGTRSLMGFDGNSANYFGIDANGYYELGNHSTVPSGNIDDIRIVKSNNNLSLNVRGETISIEGTAQANKGLHLFGIQGQTSYPTIMELYEARMYKNNTLVRNYIPCYRKLDNVIGLYDTVSKTFFTNVGTGTFIKSPTLPDEYQKVQYIQSTGTQYIDTGVLAKNNIGWDLTWKHSEISEYKAIFGARINNDRQWVDFNGTHDMVGWGNSYTLDSVDTNINNYIVNYNNSRIAKKNNGTSVDLPTINDLNINMYIFAGNYSSNNHNAKGKLYGLKITSGTELVRDFIPCYGKTDGQIGLYDMVTNTFYINEGTGKFIKGPDA